MIKKEMEKFGVPIGVEEVFEVEICEYENEDFNCLNCIETLLVTSSQTEAWDYYETEARVRMYELNSERGGLQAGGEFYGIRFNKYMLDENGDYEYENCDDYWGKYDTW